MYVGTYFQIRISPSGVADLNGEGRVDFAAGGLGSISLIEGAPGPELRVSVTHSGSITSDEDVSFTITVFDAPGASATSGALTVTDTGSTNSDLLSMSGAGGDCSAVIFCTRSDSLPAGSGYPPITAHLSQWEPSTLTEHAAVSGGGSAPSEGTDTAPVCTYAVTPPTPVSEPAAAGTLTFNVSTAAGCTWNATVSGASWITPQSTSVTGGNGSVTFHLAQKAEAARSGVVSVAGRSITITQSPDGGNSRDVDGNGVPDLLWQNDRTRQVTVNYYGGSKGASLIGWNWLNSGGVPGWHVMTVADFDGNGVPDLVWQNDTTRQVTVNHYGGPQRTSLIGWNWLNTGGAPGWHVAAAADFDGNGVPDLVWQNDTTRQMTVNYYGGPQGASLIGWTWLNAGGSPGWHVMAAADFDVNGVPDLVWQNDTTRQVTVNYYRGAQGASLIGWSRLNPGGAPGWTVFGAADFDGNGVPDLLWQNDAMRQVTVNDYGGARVLH
jgi:FG-GAP-like repeat